MQEKTYTAAHVAKLMNDAHQLGIDCGLYGECGTSEWTRPKSIQSLIFEELGKSPMVACSILFENNLLLSEDVDTWAKRFDPEYVMIDSLIRVPGLYKEKIDKLANLLISPNLENIMASSGFGHILDSKSRELVFPGSDPNAEYKQIDYYMKMIADAAPIRLNNDLTPLTIRLRYQGVDFCDDLLGGGMGVVVKEKLIEALEHGTSLMLCDSDGKFRKWIHKESDITPIVWPEGQ